MKKLNNGMVAALIGIFLLTCGTTAQALSITYTPNPVDVGDLDHYQFFAWEIFDKGIPDSGYEITGATLTINNLNDWQNEDGDHLYMHIMDSIPTGGTANSWTNRSNYNTRVWAFNDNQGGGDNWAGTPLIYTYEDFDTAAHSYSWDFGAAALSALRSYSGDNKFYLGFDPDCHYNNTGISLTITAQPVPEPNTLLFLGLGLAGAGLLRWRNRER